MASVLSAQQRCAQGVELSAEDVKQLLKDPNHWMPRLVADMGIQDALNDCYLLSYLACVAMKTYEDTQKAREDERAAYEQAQAQSEAMDSYHAMYIESGISPAAVSGVAEAAQPVLNMLQQLKQAMVDLLNQPAPVTAAQAASLNQQVLHNMQNQVLLNMQLNNPQGLALSNGQPLLAPTALKLPVAFDKVLRMNPGLVANFNGEIQSNLSQADQIRLQLARNMATKQVGALSIIDLWKAYLKANKDQINRQFFVSHPAEASFAFRRGILDAIELAVVRLQKNYAGDNLLDKVLDFLSNNNQMIIADAIQAQKNSANRMFATPAPKPALSSKKPDDDGLNTPKYKTPTPFNNQLKPKGQ